MDKTESRRIVGKYINNFLKDKAIPNAAQREMLYKKFLPTIALEEVNGLAKKWVTDANRVVVITGPEKEDVPMPTEAEVLDIFEKVDAKKLEPYEDKVSDDPLLAADLQPVGIENDKYYEEVAVTEFTLANGVKVVLKSTDLKMTKY